MTIIDREATKNKHRRKIIGVYKITNLLTRKVYIGQSRNIRNRITSHISMLNLRTHKNAYLQIDWEKYGAENFDFKVLEECEESQLNEKETYWCNYYKPNVYNLGNTHQKGTTSQELRNKIGQALKGNKLTNETKTKMSLSHKGKQLSNDTKKRMSIARQGHNVSTETRNKIASKLKLRVKSGDIWYSTKPVIIDEKIKIHGVREASRYLGVRSSSIIRAINKGHKCKGHTIQYL